MDITWRDRIGAVHLTIGALTLHSAYTFIGNPLGATLTMIFGDKAPPMTWVTVVFPGLLGAGYLAKQVLELSTARRDAA